jgi:hypothetical protein
MRAVSRLSGQPSLDWMSVSEKGSRPVRLHFLTQLAETNASIWKHTKRAAILMSRPSSEKR